MLAPQKPTTFNLGKVSRPLMPFLELMKRFSMSVNIDNSVGIVSNPSNRNVFETFEMLSLFNF